MKKIYAFLLAALVSLTLSGIPASAQCFVKITGIPAIGNLIRAKIAIG